MLGEAGHEKLLVAENLTDDVVLLDAVTGAIEKRFDLSESDAVPSTYPIALAVTKDEKRAFVALWNASKIAELDLVHGTVGRKLPLLRPTSPVAPGTHPCAFAFSPDQKTLYVTLANRDAVAAVNVGAGQFAVKGYFDTRLPGQSYFGAEPEALAVNDDGSHLYVANMATRFRRGLRHAQTDSENGEDGDGRAGRICADGVDADFHGIHGVAFRRQALRRHRKREGNRAEQLSAASGRRRAGHERKAECLHRVAGLWFTGGDR